MKTENRKQKAESRKQNADTPHSALRTPHSQRGVALVITLVLLSVITFMAVTFLVVSRAQHGAVATETDQAIARLAADTARERAIAELLAPILASGNEFNYGLVASVNYIKGDGFVPTQPLGTVDPLNVNYDYTIPPSAPLTLNQQLQNLANLLYNPRPPVFIVTNTLTARSNDFRYYLDLNRNGAFEPSGFLFLTNGQNQQIRSNGVPVQSVLVGDPQWIGGLQRPEFAHSATNFFTHRYAYLVVPAGQTLDLNNIHNNAKRLNPNDPSRVADGFLRNQGVLASEINLAAFLVDLNTNQWPGSEQTANAGHYNYSWTSLNVPNSGFAFDDAFSLLRYRYNVATYGNWNALASASGLFGPAGFNAFSQDFIDDYSAGPVMTGTWWPVGLTDADRARVNVSWAGADNPNHFYTTQDLFDKTKTAPPPGGRPTPSFTDRLLMAGTNTDSYNRYTFYRLLAQLGTDSAPEPPGKMNLNYCNVDTNTGYVVANMATNFNRWQPTNFFINAAIRLLANAGYTAGDPSYVTNLLVTNSVAGGILVTNLRIPIWPTNYYTPSVHRLLQLAANIYDSTTNRTDLTAYPYLPTVFMPVFVSIPQGMSPKIKAQMAIVGYREVTAADTSVLVSSNTPAYDLPPPPPFGNVPNPAPTMVWGIPLVVGAKKGLPNFNEFAMRTDVLISRKLEFRRAPGDQSGAIVQTNQMYVLTISNSCGIEAWNSYSNMYPRDLSIHVVVANMTAYLTDAQRSWSWLLYTNFSTNQLIAANTWSGFIDANHAANSFRYPLSTSFLMLTNSQYLQKPSPPLLVALQGQGLDFERPSGFQAPDWWLTFTNRLRFAIVDEKAVGGARIVDYVNLEACGTPVHLTGLMGGNGCAGASWNPSSNQIDEWCTNSGSGVVPFGVLNQIFTAFGTPPNWWSQNSANWPAGDFFRFQFGLSALHSTPGLVKTNTFYAPSANFPTNFSVAWQANDPLVHYTIPDLTGPASTADPMSAFGLGHLNDSYRPWGMKEADPTKNYVALKDPVVPVNPPYGSSDDWDFPANKLPNVGWLGRVHRGTSWQTVYLKAASIDVPTWMAWTGNGLIVTNFGQFATNIVLPSTAVYYAGLPTIPATITFSNGVAAYDAYFTQPPNDWHFLDLFTTALSDSATRGQLSINQTNLAAWSAALSGVCLLSNSFDANGNPSLTSQVIEPAGIYNDADPTTWPPIVQMWKGINFMRQINTNFHTLGDFLATPNLTIGGANPHYVGTYPSGYWTGTLSPFLSTNAPLSDAAIERIPQQILGLLKCDHTPRFVIYAFGQTLKPESTRAIVKSGPYAGMCTNYQIVAEVATRTVVRFEGIPQFQAGGVLPAITTLHPVIESFNVLPPD